jgi:hypothetical protein
VDSVGTVLFVLGLSTILFVGVLFALFPCVVDRSYAKRSGESYAWGMNEPSRLLLIRLTGLMSLSGFVLLCAFFVWSSS